MPFDFDPRYVETTNPVAQTLRDAAVYIREHGWCQNALDMPDGSVCVLGALQIVDHGFPSSKLNSGVPKAFWALHQHLDRDAVKYNNDDGRTKEEVIAALEGAADAVEQGNI